MTHEVSGADPAPPLAPIVRVAVLATLVVLAAVLADYRRTGAVLPAAPEIAS